MASWPPDTLAILRTRRVLYESAHESAFLCVKHRAGPSFKLEAGMRRSMRMRSWAALLSLVALGLTACNADDAKDPTAANTTAPAATGTGAPAAGGPPIKVGISLPLTGDFAEPGKGIEEGYEAWAETVNNSGGLLGR